MKPWKAVSLILFALAVAAAGYRLILVRRGFSALATPSAIEKFAATTARKMAVIGVSPGSPGPNAEHLSDKRPFIMR